MSNEYLKAINEFYDLSDSYTMNKVLIEASSNKESIVANLANRLYKNIKNDVTNIDFRSIERSKGDIKKIDGYNNLIECIDVMSKLIKEYGQSTILTDHISTAIHNIETRTRVFEKAYSIRSEIIVMTYNTMCIAIVSSISLLISTCIEYIKNKDNTITTAFDKAAYNKSKSHVLFNSMQEFNNMCRKGDFDRMTVGLFKANLANIKEAVYFDDYESLNESVIVFGTIIAIFGIGMFFSTVLNVLRVIIRNIVYWYYAMREDISTYLRIQAEFLEINAENLAHRDNGLSDEKKEKIKKEQLEWAQKFRKLSNDIMVKDGRAQNETKKKSEEDDKQKPYDDSDDEETDGDESIF